MKPTDSSQLIWINVSGKEFVLQKQSLARHPQSRLGQLIKLLKEGNEQVLKESTVCDNILQHNGQCQYYFARSAPVFESIAQYYNTGTLHSVAGQCPGLVGSELEYWGLSHRLLDPGHICTKCHTKPPESNPMSSREIKTESVVANENDKVDRLDIIGNHSFISGSSKYLSVGSNNGYINFALDVPEMEMADNYDDDDDSIVITKSTVAFHLLTFTLILTNIGLMILDSIPQFHWSNPTVKLIQFIQSASSIQSDAGFLLADNNGSINRTSEYLGDVGKLAGYDAFANSGDHMHPAWMICFRLVDWFCTIWFTIELIIRFWLSRNRSKFVRQLMTIIDLFATLPSYIELVVFYAHHDNTAVNVSGLAAFKVLRIFRIFRIFRVLKLARYEASFETLGRCLLNSYQELSLMIMYLLISTVLFGSLLFYCECDEPGTFYSTIPVAIWWSIVTYFGYADAPPATIAGKLVAAVAAIWGVLFMAFPISILVEKFSEVFQTSKEAVTAKLLEKSDRKIPMKEIATKIPATARF